MPRSSLTATVSDILQSLFEHAAELLVRTPSEPIVGHHRSSTRALDTQVHDFLARLVTGAGASASLGKTSQALSRLREFMNIFETISIDDDFLRQYGFGLHFRLFMVASTFLSLRQLREASIAYSTALDLSERAFNKFYHDDPQANLWISICHCGVGDGLLASGKIKESISSYLHSIYIAKPIANALRYQQDDEVDHPNRTLSSCYRRLGDALVAIGKIRFAIAVYRRSIKLIETITVTPEHLDWSNHNLTGSWPYNIRNLHDRAAVYGKLGSALLSAGQSSEALDVYRRSIDAAEKVIAADANSEGLFARDAAIAHDGMGDALLASGKPAEALDAYRASLAITEQVASINSDNPSLQRDLSISHGKVGDALLRMDDTDGALYSYNLSLSILNKLLASDESNYNILQIDLALANARIGDVFLRTNKIDRAISAYRKAHKITQVGPVISVKPWAGELIDYPRIINVLHGRKSMIYALNTADIIFRALHPSIELRIEQRQNPDKFRNISIADFGLLQSKRETQSSPQYFSGAQIINIDHINSLLRGGASQEEGFETGAHSTLETKNLEPANIRREAESSANRLDIPVGAREDFIERFVTAAIVALTPALPAKAPEPYKPRGPENIVAFLRRVWRPWIQPKSPAVIAALGDQLLSRAKLSELDPRAGKAVVNWLGSNPLPDDIFLPTPEQINDALTADERAVRLAGRVVSASRRRADRPTRPSTRNASRSIVRLKR
jgi:tetratricopeptide (TPR) repeat protein